MVVKKQNLSLKIQPNMKDRITPLPRRLSLLLPGCLFVAAITGLLVSQWQLGAAGFFLLIPGIAALLCSLILSWDKKWQIVTFMGILVLAGIGFILFRSAFSASVAALLNKISIWHLNRTGYYSPEYENAGNPLLAAAVLTALYGSLTGFGLRWKGMLVQLPVFLLLLLAWMAGWLTGGSWWLSLYGAGLLLSFAGKGKATANAGAVVAVVALCVSGVLLITGFIPQLSDVGKALHKSVHHLRYEKEENPMPEGDFSQLSAYTPGSSPALAVTMEHWTPLYIKGFTAGAYTPDGWQPIGAFSENAETLYALQKDYFISSEQIAAAWNSLGTDSENTIHIENLGACSAYAYLPYGSSGISKTPSELKWEGIQPSKDGSYEAAVYPPENSYLLQGELSKVNASDYLNGESAYRDWVYARYLEIPEETHNILSRYLTAENDITTVQAKRQIIHTLNELLTYDEATETVSGDKDFTGYVLDVSKRGYSVHYATLAAMMLRFYGIPARYAEGYVVTPTQAVSLSDGDTLTLTQSNSHAWAEYYLDGVGWLPFDATPGYQDILVYELPTEGAPTDNTQNSIQQEEQSPPPQAQTPPVTQQPDRHQRQGVTPKQVLGFILIAAFALTVLLVLRTIILRKRLKKRQAVYENCNARLASAAIMCDMGIFLKLKQNISAKELSQEIAAYTHNRISASDAEKLIYELWFSHHEISQQQRETALCWLSSVRKIWQENTPAILRFYQRFILCKIL